MVTIVRLGIGQPSVQIGRHRDLLGSPQIRMGKVQYNMTCSMWHLEHFYV